MNYNGLDRYSREGITFPFDRPDTQQIGQGVVVNVGNWQQQLENNKQAFTAEFVLRSR